MDNARRRFLTHIREERSCAENTILAYTTDLEQLSRVIAAGKGEPASLGSLTPETLSDYVNWLMQQGYKPATVSRKIAAVRSFINYLNTYEGIGGPKLSEELRSPPTPRRQPRILSREETAALLEAPAEFDSPRALRDRAILELLTTTGFRAAEVVNLSLEDVNLNRREVYLSSSTDDPVPLGAATYAMHLYIQRGRPHLVRKPQVRAFFLNQRGQRFSRQGLWLVVKRWAAVAGLSYDVSPQTIRNTLIQNLLSEGKTRKDVQKFLRLSSPNAVWVRREIPQH